MEATKKRNIRSGVEYDRYFPPADAKVFTVKRNATLSDTIALIPKVVYQTLSQSRDIAQQILKRDSVYATCKEIWYFVYRHIQYKKDKKGYEQIRSPARAWHDRATGVDCDCYSVFISSILTNLDIPHILRITRYSEDFFQHIYPVVPLNNGKYVTIDCVTNQFDFEVPYSEKKDYPMDLQYLSGFDSDSSLQGGDGMDELGRIIRRSMAKNKSGAASPMKKRGGLMKRMKATAASNVTQPAAQSSEPSDPPVKKKKKKFFGKVLNKINKINPATVLLRNGILAAMKLNVMSVAKRLRWSYLSQQQAVQHGIDPARFAKLVKVREKLENIFYGAGGKPQNLKKAILGGKGNKDKAVHGLGEIDLYGVDYMNTNTPLEQLLGPDIYHSENVEGMNGFQGLGELGEPVTAASVTAAMGVITGIVASLKKIGDIFKGNGKGSEDFNEEKTDTAEKDSPVSTGQSATQNQADTAPAPDNKVNNEDQPASLPATQSRFAARMTTNRQAATASDNSNADESPASKPTTQSVNTDNDSSDQDSTDEDNSTPASTQATQNLQVQKVATDNGTPTANKSESKNDNSGPDDKKSFWQKNKGWIKPVAIGVGGIGLLVIVSKLIGHHKPQNNNSPGSHLSGITHKGKRKNYQRRSKSKKQKKSPVALM